MHIQDREMCNWIRDRLETPQQYSFTTDEKVSILDRLTWATQFERFLGIKVNYFSSNWQLKLAQHGGTKRFGLDGCESLIPGLKAMIDRSADLGVENIVMGMPHRGRLNVLANVVRKPLEAIFHEFSDKSNPSESYIGSGDVKYHLGTTYERPTPNGKKVRISLMANPSHLEAVNPVVEGKGSTL